MDARQVARGLAWFGIGLGLLETIAPGAVARAAGLDDHEGTIRAFGLREIASGVIVLAAREPERWLWLRAAGDGLDGALLARGMRPGNPGQLRAVAATLAVTPVVALDMVYSYKALAPAAA